MLTSPIGRRSAHCQDMHQRMLLFNFLIDTDRYSVLIVERLAVQFVFVLQLAYREMLHDCNLCRCNEQRIADAAKVVRVGNSLNGACTHGRADLTFDFIVVGGSVAGSLLANLGSF